MPVVGNHLTVVVDNSLVKGSTSITDSLLAIVTDKPSAAVAEPQAVAVKLLTMVADKLSAAVAEPQAVAVELLTMVVDKLSAAIAEPHAVAVELLAMAANKLSAAEPMYNIDNRLSKPMFDAEKSSAVRYDNQTNEQFYQYPYV